MRLSFISDMKHLPLINFHLFVFHTVIISLVSQDMQRHCCLQSVSYELRHCHYFKSYLYCSVVSLTRRLVRNSPVSAKYGLIRIYTRRRKIIVFLFHWHPGIYCTDLSKMTPATLEKLLPFTLGEERSSL